MRESLVLLSATFVTLNKANLPSVSLSSFNDVHFSRFSKKIFRKNRSINLLDRRKYFIEIFIPNNIYEVSTLYLSY